MGKLHIHVRVPDIDRFFRRDLEEIHDEAQHVRRGLDGKLIHASEHDREQVFRVERLHNLDRVRMRLVGRDGNRNTGALNRLHRLNHAVIGMRTVEAVLLVMLGIEFQHLVRLVFVFRRDGVFAHVVDAVTDDRRHAGLGQRGKTAGSQRKIEAVGEVMECVDERAVKVKYAELYHDCFFLSFCS